VEYFSAEPLAKPMNTTELGGTIVLTGPGRFRHFLYHLRTREITELPGTYLGFGEPLEVSPARTAFAYTEMTALRTIRVYVGRDEGRRLTPHLIPDEGRWIVLGWLDDDYLTLADVERSDGSIKVMNSIDGSLTRIGPPFPLSTENGPLAWIAGEIYARYNRARSHVVTARWIDNQADVEPFVPMRYTYELWDAYTPRLLWTASGGGFSGPPVWNASGDNFVVAYPPYRNPPDFYSMCAEVHVVSVAAADRLLDDCSWPGGYSWSPDGTRIAAWRGEQGERRSEYIQLQVFDLAQSSIRRYAIRFDKYAAVNRPQPPVWSPDGLYLAFSEMDESLVGPLRSWILDLETGEVQMLMSGTLVEGWVQ
jgi:hypothetical protein